MSGIVGDDSVLGMLRKGSIPNWLQRRRSIMFQCRHYRGEAGAGMSGIDLQPAEAC